MNLSVLTTTGAAAGGNMSSMLIMLLVYGAVIAGMLYSVLRYCGAYAAWFRFAALLFVFSDGVIAWSRSRAHLCRDGSLLPGAVPVLLLCRKIASRPPV